MAVTANRAVRSFFFLCGLFFISLGINITISSNFGVGGWDAAQIGMVKHFGMTIGFWLNMWACVYLIISAILEKKRIKVECFLTSIILGICIDLWQLLFSHLHVEAMPFTLLLFLLGVTTTSLGAGLYLVSKLPVNPIDHLMVVLSEKFQLPLSIAKYIVEGSGMLLGLLLGGPVGMGTILMIVIFGPLIQFFTKRSRLLLDALERK